MSSPDVASSPPSRPEPLLPPLLTGSSRSASPSSPTGASPTWAARASTPATSPRPSCDLGHHVEVLGGQPYPMLDDAGPPGRAAQPRHLQRPLPDADARARGSSRTSATVVEVTAFSLGTFPEPLAFSVRAWQHLRTRVNDFDLVQDNQCLGYGLLGIERAGLPVLATIHHPITVDRRLEMEHAETTLEALLQGAAGTPSPRCRPGSPSRMRRVITVSQNSFDDIDADHEVARERLHIVPVGVDPDLFKPLPDVERIPGRLITTASADVTMKGLRYLLEAVAKLRTERRRRAGRHRPAQGGRPVRPASSTSWACATPSTFVTGVPDERIVELYSEAELAVVPSLYEGFSLPAIEAMSCGVPAGRHHRRRPPRGRRPRRRDRPHRAPGRQRGPGRRHRAAPSTTPSCGPASARPAASGSSTAGLAPHRGRHRRALPGPAGRDPHIRPVDRAAGTAPLSRRLVTPTDSCDVLTVDYDRLGLRAGDRVLDLGCGFGRHAFEALPPRRPRRRLRLWPTPSSSRCATLFGAMKDAGEVARRAARHLGAGRRHHACRSPTTPSTASSPPRSSSTSPTTSPPSTS